MRVCFLGESFVNGTGDPECLGWSGRLCRATWQRGLDLTYYNLGIRRETSTELRNRWLSEVRLRLPPDVDGRLVFSFGVNDTAWQNGQTRVSIAHSIENVQQILKAAKAQFPVLVVGAPPVLDAEHTARIEALSEQMAIVAQELDVPYLEVVSRLKDSEVWMREIAAYDGAHPNAGGYEAMSAIVQDWEAWQNWMEQD